MMSSAGGVRSNPTEMEPVWPFCTPTRVVCALITIGCGSTRPLDRQPRIFLVSVSTFSSSPPPMYGITLPRMSHEATPGYPAPEIACRVAMIVLFNPNGRSGASAIAWTTTAQFGFVTMRPFQPRNELRTDHPGGAENTNIGGCHGSLRKQKSRRGRNRVGCVNTRLDLRDFKPRAHKVRHVGPAFDRCAFVCPRLPA